MKAAVLIKYGSVSSAFEIREVPKPIPAPGEVLIKVAAFGLNFADVMARNNLYKEAPPLPAILGYDVAGIVESVGEQVADLKPGDRVVAMTRFGGYAQYAVTNSGAVAIIPDDLDFAAATALATQYCTAYYAAAEMMNLYPGDKVLIQSGAGGVGAALIQYATYKGCEIFSTAGSDEKVKLLLDAGVQHPINYRTQDFEREIKNITGGKGVTAIFDAVGGSYIKKGFRSLSPGGRIVCYGASGLTGENIFSKIITLIGFGFYHPLMLMMPSKSIIGINMLTVADHEPAIVQRCLKAVMKLTTEGVFKPTVGKSFGIQELAAAHEFLENRKSVGKIAIHW